MGSLAKKLGQLSRKSLESESAHLFKTIKANKMEGSLSQALDGTLKQGHDMRIFGLGTMASMESRERYQRFLANLHAVYSTMEEELDATSIPAIRSDTIRAVWMHHGDILRRSDALAQDLEELQSLLDSSTKAIRVSPCTLNYLQAIRWAGEEDRETGGGRLLGHLYCRYFADLFGGQMLGKPYALALQLPQTPRHLRFELEVGRKAYLEHLYTDINKAGKLLTKTQFQEVVDESLLAFRHNVNIYSEEPKMVTSAIKGGMNLVLGWTTSYGKTKATTDDSKKG